jgi:hypothetical protein
MEYFRSLGTSLLQQSGVVLPFAIGERVTEFDQEGTIWTMYDAVKRVRFSPYLACLLAYSALSDLSSGLSLGRGMEDELTPGYPFPSLFPSSDYACDD